MQATGSELSDPSAHEAGGAAAAGRGARAAAREASSEQTTRGGSQQGSHPNRWLELGDGWAIKTVYKSTLQHQQCPIAGAPGAGRGVRVAGPWACLLWTARKPLTWHPCL